MVIILGVPIFRIFTVVFARQYEWTGSAVALPLASTLVFVVAELSKCNSFSVKVFYVEGKTGELSCLVPGHVACKIEAGPRSTIGRVPDS